MQRSGGGVRHGFGAGRANDREARHFEESPGEIRAGLVLFERAHIREEDGRAVTRFFRLRFHRLTQFFKRTGGAPERHRFYRGAGLILNAYGAGDFTECRAPHGRVHTGLKQRGVRLANDAGQTFQHRLVLGHVRFGPGGGNLFRAPLLKRGQVHHRHFKRLFGYIRIHVGADDTIAPLRDVLESFGRNLGHFRLRPSGLHCPGHTSALFDFLEQRPSAPGQLVRERLDKPRTTGRINHLGEMTFLAQ
ncbi:MAG: hypothetical protein BWX84_01940 [Verrucomicrobia bacterium ADurb.Bin118]|nr:MAG: hypothetical protein BWX84_01940 [Verrucomicrobia bacterium ADurb.Bin118]